MPVMQTAQGPVFVDENMLGLGGGGNYAASSFNRAAMDLPQPWSAVQTGAAPFGDNPMANGLFNMIAPMIAGAVTGGGFNGFNPTLGGPMQSPSAGYISQAYTTPALRQAQFVTAGEFGNRMAGTVGNIANGPMAGMLEPLLSAFNTTPDALQAKFAGLGGSAPGAMMAQMASAFAPVQAVTGGNFMSIADKSHAAAFYAATAGGNLPDFQTGKAPTTIAAMNDLAKREAQRLTNAIYGTGGSAMQDQSFTQGFRTDDIAELNTFMHQANFKVNDGGRMTGYSASSDEAKTAGLKTMLKTLRAVGEALGSENMTELMGQLDKLTQGNLANVNKEQLIQQIDAIQGVAEAVGVSGRQMLQSVMQNQQQMGDIAGLTAGGNVNALRDVNGNIIGGAGSVGLATQMTGRVMSMALLSGDRSAANLKKLEADEAGLQRVGLSSGHGRAQLAVEFLREQGGVSEAAYGQLQDALKNGTREEQQKAYDRIFATQGGFGSYADVVERFASDEDFRTQIMAVGAEGWKNFDAARVSAQSSEYGQRREQQRGVRAMQTSRLLAEQTGIDTYRMPERDQKRFADAQFGGMLSALDASKDPEAARLSAVLRDTYARSEDDGGGITGVRSLMESSRFDKYRSSMETAGIGARTRAEADFMKAGGRGETAAGLTAQMSEADRILAGRRDDKSLDAARALGEARDALASGDTAKAQRLFAQAQGALSTSERGFIADAGAAAKQTYAQTMANQDVNAALAANPGLAKEMGYFLGLARDSVAGGEGYSGMTDAQRRKTVADAAAKLAKDQGRLGGVDAKAFEQYITAEGLNSMETDAATGAVFLSKHIGDAKAAQDLAARAAEYGDARGPEFAASRKKFAEVHGYEPAVARTVGWATGQIDQATGKKYDVFTLLALARPEDDVDPAVARAMEMNAADVLKLTPQEITERFGEYGAALNEALDKGGMRTIAEKTMKAKADDKAAAPAAVVTKAQPAVTAAKESPAQTEQMVHRNEAQVGQRKQMEAFVQTMERGPVLAKSEQTGDKGATGAKKQGQQELVLKGELLLRDPLGQTRTVLLDARGSGGGL